MLRKRCCVYLCLPLTSHQRILKTKPALSFFFFLTKINHYFLSGYHKVQRFTASRDHLASRLTPPSPAIHTLPTALTSLIFNTSSCAHTFSYSPSTRLGLPSSSSRPLRASSITTYYHHRLPDTLILGSPLWFILPASYQLEHRVSQVTGHPIHNNLELTFQNTFPQQQPHSPPSIR